MTDPRSPEAKLARLEDLLGQYLDVIEDIRALIYDAEALGRTVIWTEDVQRVLEGVPSE